MTTCTRGLNSDETRPPDNELNCEAGCFPNSSALLCGVRPQVCWEGLRRKTKARGAFLCADGKIIWDFDTAQSFDAVNKVPAKGGSLDVGGPVIAGGMAFVVSGYPGFGAMPGNALLAFSTK